MRRYIQHIIRYIILTLFQVIVLNNINICGFLCPYLYVLIILMLPANIENWLMVIISMFVGLTIDFFSGTIGLHASACVLMGACYHSILRFFINNREMKPGTVADIQFMGLLNYTLFTLIMITVHHLALFFLDAFTLKSFLVTLGHAGLNILLTLAIVLPYQLIFRSRVHRYSY